MKSTHFMVLTVLGALVLTSAFPTAGFSQGRGRGKGGGMGKGERSFPPPGMVERLNLADEQVQQLKAVHKKYRDETASTREKIRQAHETLRAAMESDASEEKLRQNHEAVHGARKKLADTRFEEALAVRKILTPEQRKQFRGMMDQKQDRRGSFGQGRGRGGKRRGGPSSDFPLMDEPPQEGM